MMLDKQNTIFVLVDVQGNLAGLMHDKQSLFNNLQKLIKSIQILNIPIVWLEQNPEAIGATIPAIASLLPEQQPISKLTFSAYRNDEFKGTIEQSNCQHVIIAGIEAHVCVYQTAMDLHNNGYQVSVVGDAVSSRTQSNKQMALLKMQKHGITLTSTEMAIFELLEIAQGPAFKQIIKIIK